MTKRLHPGIAAKSGVSAALLARRGFFGGQHVLEAADGGFLAATSDDPRPEEATRGLGTEWRAEGACFKPYACCGSNHASVDAALSLKRKHGLTIEEVDKIDIGVSRVVLLQTGFAYRKSTVLNAQMSIRYNVAVALCDDQALVEQFTPERLDDPRLNALIDRIDVAVDPEMDAIYPGRYAGIVAIRLKDGREFRERVDFSRGMPENPMTREELAAKFLSLAGTAVGRDEAEALLPDVERIFETPDVAGLARRLGQLRVSPRGTDP